ncbi:putative lipoprotein [Streptococcus cristatus]|uniref:Lipoprotein n=2 Tax=Streptococcus cristatus TaxID=45634 RepID=A0A512AAS7_STRCR|nr:hypothetical protein [Streptococcus cristatus]AGK70674.1 hypothetical protein I872_02845 [Streptococcus cristatus AS 1.3089]GEN96811.1 hypothetical protein SOL01_06850 [Streptococcus cristatus]SQI46545.1 putative lipoprotein [Streptococcus cristatus]
MKKIKKYITLIFLGGVAVLSIALINGWRLDDYTVPKNRTREQYDFEGTFEPMFKFLEQDKKDFTGLKAYICDVYIKVGDQVKDYQIDLDITESAIKGDYTITHGDTKEKVPVTYSNGKLSYGSEINPLFDEEILNLVVQRAHFASLDVKETFKSAETELRDIIYEPENSSDLYKYLKNKYDMPDDTTCRIRVSYSSYTIYGVTIQMKSSEKSVQIRSTVLKK